jgi:hypothetical protein
MTAEISSLGIFEDYLKAMEDFLAQQAELIRNKRLKYLEEEHGISKEDYGKLDDADLLILHWTTDLAYAPEYSGLSDYDDYFPKILRQSLFTSLYANLEKFLNSQCHELKRTKNLSLSLNDLNGENTLSRARNYLTKVAQVDFPDGKEWQIIQTYRKLRNCLAHNNGELSGLSDSDAKSLKEYAQKHPFLEVKEFPSITVIEVKKGFCEEAVKVIDAFSVKLIESCVKKQFES